MFHLVTLFPKTFKLPFTIVNMATIEFNDNTAEIPDGEEIKEQVEALGIPFSCKDGRCGTCLINILSGAENLSDLNDKEKEFGLLDNKTRLSCQCRIKHGNVKIESGY